MGDTFSSQCPALFPQGCLPHTLHREAVSPCSERGHHFTNPGTACSCAGSVQQHFLQLYCSDFGRQNSFLCSQSSFYIFSILCLVFPPKLALMISCHSKNNNNHLQGDSSATIGFETSVKICENKIKSAFLQEPPFPPAEAWPSLHTMDSALCPPPSLLFADWWLCAPDRLTAREGHRLPHTMSCGIHSTASLHLQMRAACLRLLARPHSLR